MKLRANTNSCLMTPFAWPEYQKKQKNATKQANAQIKAGKTWKNTVSSMFFWSIQSERRWKPKKLIKVCEIFFEEIWPEKKVALAYWDHTQAG